MSNDFIASPTGPLSGIPSTGGRCEVYQCLLMPRCADDTVMMKRISSRDEVRDLKLALPWHPQEDVPTGTHPFDAIRRIESPSHEQGFTKSEQVYGP